MLAKFAPWKTWWGAVPPSPSKLVGLLDLSIANFDWLAGVGGGTSTAYHFKSGLSSGNYTRPVVIVPSSNTMLPVSAVISSSGTYYCTMSAVNAAGESPNANEVRLVVGLAITSIST